MQRCDWIIFYDEAKGRYNFLPVGSKEARFVLWKVTKGFYGTYSEAKAEAKRLERAAGITGRFPNKHSYQQ